MVVVKQFFYRPRFRISIRAGSKILGVGLEMKSQSDFFLDGCPFIRVLTPLTSGNTVFVSLEFWCEVVEGSLGADPRGETIGDAEWFNTWTAFDSMGPAESSNDFFVVGEFNLGGLAYIVNCFSSVGQGINAADQESEVVRAVEGRNNSDETFVRII